MSDVVENISEQQKSAPSIEAAQPTEVVSEEISNNVEAAKEAVPAAIGNASVATLETAEEPLPKPIAEESSSTSPKVDNKKTPVSIIYECMHMYVKTNIGRFVVCVLNNDGSGVQLTRLRDKAYLVNLILYSSFCLVVILVFCHIFILMIKTQTNIKRKKKNKTTNMMKQKEESVITLPTST